VGGAGNRT